jgi:hypothetical protein
MDNAYADLLAQHTAVWRDILTLVMAVSLMGLCISFAFEALVYRPLVRAWRKSHKGGRKHG